MKTCSKCKQLKHEREFYSRFYKARRVPWAYCRACANAFDPVRFTASLQKITDHDTHGKKQQKQNVLQMSQGLAT